MTESKQYEQLFEQWRGKTVAVCGIGRNNLPVIRQLLSYNIRVRACDQRSEEALGDTASQLRGEGVELCLGEGYLDRLDDVIAILRTPGMKPHLPPFERARERGIPVTSEMELFLEWCPARVYAVTGSDGKTTTTTILAGLWEAAGKRVFVGGNIGRPLLPILGEITEQDVVVAELSSFQLMRMTQSPQVAVITNVAPNHLDWHADMSEYEQAKHNLVRYQHRGDRAVLNADNEITARFADEAERGEAQVMRFSRHHRLSEGAWLSEEGMLCYSHGGVTIPMVRAEDILLPGDHNIENYLAAIAAVGGEISPEIVARYAKTFGGVEHRCELVRVRNGVRWYNDSIGTSPSRTIAGLKAFHRKVILVAGGYDKHIPYDTLGPVAAETVQSAILLGATADAIERSIRAWSDLPIYRVSTMEEAVATADRISQEGDVVFLSPASASFDLYRNFEERGQHFKRLVHALEP